MEKIRFKLISPKRFLFIFSALSLIISSCSEESMHDFPYVVVSKIEFSEKIISLTIGDTHKLTATISPEDATDKTLTWESSNTNVATVENGKITAIGGGYAIITAKSGNVQAKCTVTVNPAEVTAITLSQTSITITKGDTYDLIATISPEEAKGRTLTWESSNANVATVKNGKITAAGEGSATITAKSGKVQAKCEVTVNPVEVTAITLSQSSVTLTQGKTYRLIATISPEDAADKTVTWESSNTNVATVENGKITAVGVGSAIITAKRGNVQAKCEVTVNPIKVASIKLSQTSITINKGDVYNLTATVSPEDAADKTVTWESSNTNVATVENGKITAVGVGSATITAKSGKVQAKCIVTVNPVEVTAITLSQTLVRLTQGKTYNLIATIAPSNATDKTVTWESSNTNVATVENGKIIAVGVGSATITAKSGNVQAVCTVRVKSLDGKPLPGGSEGTGEIEW